MTESAPNPSASIERAVKEILSIIDAEREREIISRRFGLYDRRETLEQIGELLGITRERVRQLEKAILIRLKITAEEGRVPAANEVERLVIRVLSEKGRVGRVSEVTLALVPEDGGIMEARLVFLSELSSKLSVLSENDLYYYGIGIRDYGDEKQVKKTVDEIVKVIRDHGQPITLDTLHSYLPAYEHPDHIRALASLSKQLSNLGDKWGLTKWPTVNPKNIRDKIFVILSDQGKPMHFSEIAKAIKNSGFKRAGVTTQAIHNELIKDKRFVLIGRGIYALESWGFERGTVADIISDILKKAGGPLHRDEIVRRVLKSRQVKETTILLNLQSKPQFKRVAKATYAMEDAR